MVLCMLFWSLSYDKPAIRHIREMKGDSVVTNINLLMGTLSSQRFFWIFCFNPRNPLSLQNNIGKMRISSISFARLYLGVHSPMDVKGGLLLGLAIVAIAKPLGACSLFDAFMLQTPHVGEGGAKGAGKCS